MDALSPARSSILAQYLPSTLSLFGFLIVIPLYYRFKIPFVVSGRQESTQLKIMTHVIRCEVNLA